MRIGFISGGLLSLIVLIFSCNPSQENSTPSSSGPKVVESKGYVVPQDSMAPPKVIVVDESKLRRIPVGKPKLFPTNTNIHAAGTPKEIVVYATRFCTPGQGPIMISKTLPAQDSTFEAGIPELIHAKDADSRDQNPHSFSIFTKQNGLTHDGVGSVIRGQ